MFNKILVANRGVIASRVIRTCKKLGIETVAIYSEVDSTAPHVKNADEAYLVGGARVNESYLNIEEIIKVAKESNAEAIHPGYGFLSENEYFARKCEKEKIKFIGPTPEVISKMGSKIEARKIMKSAGVPVIPGTSFSLKNTKEAKIEAGKMGYPIMLKASAGGGGIGMQIVNNDKELVTAFEGNQKRAKDFFGDGSMFMEKYIDNPRHIEIQILADEKGNTVYLWERECSIQRRHQKVIEEAPSVFLDENKRNEMGEAAIKAAKSINYKNAGTIEFLVDSEKNFYFLEMNTRLQVEHPVTEEITRLDLVEEQLNIAYGQILSFKQEDIKLDGHAIEVRIYAEDPKTFFPSPGKITKFDIPQDEGVRHELSVDENYTVTPYYDPMIAKLIIHSCHRQTAIDQLIKVLEDYTVEGIKTNIPMLLRILNNEDFKKGYTTTNFIQSNM